MFEDYYGQPNDSLLQYLLAASGGQSLPTEQPVTAEPAPAEQSLPTEQPVVAEPVPSWETNPALSGVDWAKAAEALANSNFNLNNFSVLTDPGPAYDPNMVYRFDTGNKIGVPKEGGGWEYQNAAPVVFQPGQQYVLTDRSGKNVIARASTPEEMQKLVDLSSSKGDWALYRADANGNITPGAQLFSKNESLSLGSMLPYMAAIAGTAFGLNALGLGAGAAGAGAGTAGTAAGTAAGTTAALGGTAASGTLAAAAPAFGGITVVGAPAAGIGAALVPTLAATGTLGAALAAAQPGPVNYGDQVYDQPTQDITVNAPKLPPLSLDEIATLPAATTLAPNTSNITKPSTLKPGEGSLLGDIMKYYSIGSGVLDALGVGQGGTTAPTTAYTPTLGAVPTFGRGQFQPFTGDYETYGQGPEWSFFAQPAAVPATPAAPFTLLPPPTTTSA